jgi:glycosyltransferase involved in cell wall biosynthesis
MEVILRPPLEPLGTRDGRKLLVINNGLKNLRGHYFETSVSVMDAAARAGLQPVLVGHATCPENLVPEWMDFLPICRTDHWMVEEPPPQVDLGMIRCDARAAHLASMHAVLAGKSSVTDYLSARFYVQKPLRASRHKLQMPPLLRRWSSKVKRAVRKIVPKSELPRRVLETLAFPPRTLVPFTPRLRHRFDQECLHAMLFLQDMETVLSLSPAGADDHVFFPTAHARELLAVRQLVERLPPEICPTFHLEFRHALDFDESGRMPHGYYSEMHSLLFDTYRWNGHHPRIQLYTDTEELSECYSQVSGLPFGTLPIPFRTNLIQGRYRGEGEPITLAMLGDVRDEKGFPLLPDLAEALRPQLERGELRLLIQATLAEPHYNPRSTAALTRLKKLAIPNIELHGLKGPLHPNEYFALLSVADVILLPYDAAAYGRRSSGVLTEAMAAGIPTIVTAGTWLARQQPLGTGETFADPAGFEQAVRKLLANYPFYLAPAQQFRQEWLRRHTPDNLIDALVGSTSRTYISVSTA